MERGSNSRSSGMEARFFLLEATHLIYRLQPYGYGKEILRAKFKIYLADPAIASAVLLKGSNVLDSPRDLGIATETAVFKHL